jgi:hypothetical protein
MKKRKLVQVVFLKGIFAKGGISPWLILLVCGVLMLPVLFVACVENNKPGIIYDTSLNITTTGKPNITAITPATKAIAGVREIRIFGKNLGIKNGTDTNWVVIGGTNATIKEIIQDSVVTIYRPKLSNDHYDKNISVSVTDPKMLAASSSVEYYVESPGGVVGDYSTISSPLLAVDFDKQENLYTTAGKNLYKTDFAGVTQSIILNPVNLLSSDYNSITAMSFGPGAYGRNLFIAVGKNYIARIYVVDTLDRNDKPVKLTVPAVVSQLDFDENGNMYTGGNGNLYITDSAGTSAAPTFTPISGYEGVNIIKIRVVKESGNQFLYVADSTYVWKSQLGGSSLIKGTPLVDLSTHSELSGCTISSFEVDENGSIFLCLKNHPKYSLFIRENDGSIAPFYNDPNILPKTVENLTWGNSKYLYLMSSSLQSSPGTYVAGRIYRMTLDRNGAPYQGRSFIK